MLLWRKDKVRILPSIITNKYPPIMNFLDPKQAENNPYGLKNEKPKELYKHSVKSLKKSVSQSNHRV